jgi:hypothetical protein
MRYRETYYADTFTKNGASGEGIQDLDCSLERCHDLSIFSSKFAEPLCLLLKNRRYGVDRLALFELFCEGMII